MFDQCSWRLIKEFVGIYGISMNYAKIPKLTQKVLRAAYKVDSEMFDKFKDDYWWSYVSRHDDRIFCEIMIADRFGQNVADEFARNPESIAKALIALRTRKDMTDSQRHISDLILWEKHLTKATILQHMAKGYKSRAIYEELSKHASLPTKVTCMCGLKFRSTQYARENHYKSKHHINRVLLKLHESDFTIEVLSEPTCSNVSVPEGYPRIRRKKFRGASNVLSSPNSCTVYQFKFLDDYGTRKYRRLDLDYGAEMNAHKSRIGHKQVTYDDIVKDGWLIY